MLETPVKVGTVSYNNAKPLLYGLEKGMMQDDIVLIRDFPARIADMLVRGEIDLGLVPVAVIPSLREHHIVSDYCIACDGPVASVCIFSDVPIEDVESLWLDYQSRTSAALTRILLREHWKVNPVLMQAQPGFEQMIGDKQAGLVIGDRALELRSRFRYVYDLGEAWKSMTGLPFVFAAWISNKPLPEGFPAHFNMAVSAGLSKLSEVAAETEFPAFSLLDYYTQYIKFRLNNPMREAIALFLAKIQELT